MKKRDFLDAEILQEFNALFERKLSPSEMLHAVHEKFQDKLDRAHHQDLAFYLEAIYGIDAIDLMGIVDQWLPTKVTRDGDERLNKWICDLSDSASNK